MATYKGFILCMAAPARVGVVAISRLLGQELPSDLPTFSTIFISKHRSKPTVSDKHNDYKRFREKYSLK